MNELKSSISQKQYVFIFFRKLLVKDGGGAVGEEETDPMDRGQQVFWKTIWNFQKYLQIFISLEICPVWCTISTVKKQNCGNYLALQKQHKFCLLKTLILSGTIS